MEERGILEPIPGNEGMDFTQLRRLICLAGEAEHL